MKFKKDVTGLPQEDPFSKIDLNPVEYFFEKDRDEQDTERDQKKSD